MTLYQLMH